MRVRDIVTKDYKIASVRQTVSSALDKVGRAGWVVIKQQGNLPVGIIETDRLADYHGNRLLINVVPTLSHLVVVPANMDIKRAAQSLILRDLPSENTVGVLAMGERTVHGIWPKSDVAKTLMAFRGTVSASGGMSSNISDSFLPGRIRIKRPTVLCGFIDSNRICPATSTQMYNDTEFTKIMKLLHREELSQVLLCLNPLRLKPHRFGEKS